MDHPDTGDAGGQPRRGESEASEAPDEDHAGQHTTSDGPSEKLDGPRRPQAVEPGHGVVPPRPPRRTGVFVEPEGLREHVGGLLRAILGGYEVDAFGNFTFIHDDARVFVTVGGSPVGPQVGVFSVTNLDVKLTPELGSFLLTTNHTLGFGSFSYDAHNHAVWLRHTLLGTALDLPELQAAVIAVASTAAAVDDHIRDDFGGRTFQDAPSDVQRRMEPPSPHDATEAPNAGGYL